MTGITAIRIRKGDHIFHVHGEHEGAEGVTLAQGGVDGIYDAPVKTTYKSGALQDGSKQKSKKYLHRDMQLGFHVQESKSHTYEYNDSRFRQLFDYEVDTLDPDPDPTLIELETEMSGLRCLEVLKYEQPDFSSKRDSIQQQYGNLIMKLRAPQPMWFEAEDGFDFFEAATTTGSGTVEIENPTDQVIRQEWVLTRGIWTIPDYQWVGKKGQRAPGGVNGGRVITIPEIATINGGARVSLDRTKLMLRDANDTNFLPLLNGKFFKYPIPPYTPKTLVPVSYTGAPGGGARCEIRMPLRWSYPWGQELIP